MRELFKSLSDAFADGVAVGLDRRHCHDALREGTRQQSLGCALVQPPSTQVEQRTLVELANRRAVTAFDFVGVNLELGFRIDLGLFGKQQVVVCLLCIRAVGPGVDNGFAVPNAARRAAENATVLL